MAIKVMVGGQPVWPETEEDLLMVLALARRLEGSAPPSEADTPPTPKASGKAAPKEEETPRPENKWITVMAKLAASHYRFLAYVKANDGAMLKDIVTGLGLPAPNSIGGTVRTIELYAERAGFKPNEIFRKEEKGSRPNKITRYFAGPALRAAEVPAA